MDTAIQGKNDIKNKIHIIIKSMKYGYGTYCNYTVHRREYFRAKMQHFTQDVMFFLVASIPIYAK